MAQERPCTKVPAAYFTRTSSSFPCNMSFRFTLGLPLSTLQSNWMVCVPVPIMVTLPTILSDKIRPLSS